MEVLDMPVFIKCSIGFYIVSDWWFQGYWNISLGIGLVKDLLDWLHKETSFSHPGK